MRKLLVATSLLVLSSLNAQSWATQEQYIQRFAKYAVEEMEKYKIPASIKLAQGLLETGGGQSRLAKEGNNHFGIKCKDDWTGRSMKHTDDAPNECFRVYDDPKQSYEDHSKFLATRKFYQNLFNLDPKDYKAWAHGLKKAGYATNPKYAYILINTIEKYRLYEYDNVTSETVNLALLRQFPDLEKDPIFLASNQSKNKKEDIKKDAVTVKVPYRQTSYANQQKTVERIKTKAEILNTMLVKNHPNGGLKYVVVPEDTQLRFIANKFRVSEKNLMKWNELENNFVKKNSIIFLEAKNSSGNVATYVCEEGEDMYAIAQKFAVKLDRLYTKNRMAEGERPRQGQLIYLIDKKPR